MVCPPGFTYVGSTCLPTHKDAKCPLENINAMGFCNVLKVVEVRINPGCVNGKSRWNGTACENFRSNWLSMLLSFSKSLMNKVNDRTSIFKLLYPMKLFLIFKNQFLKSSFTKYSCLLFADLTFSQLSHFVNNLDIFVVIVLFFSWLQELQIDA